MIWAVLKVMILGLVRDRGALVMAFLLPPFIFVIFAAIFSGTSGDEMRLQVATFDQVKSDQSARLIAAIRLEPTLRLYAPAPSNPEQVRRLVFLGLADAGLVIRAPLTENGGAAPILILADAGKAVTGPIMHGHVQRLIADHLPQINLRRLSGAIDTLTGGFTPEQRQRLDAGLDELPKSPDDLEDSDRPGLVEMEMIGGQSGDNAIVSYFAGSVAVMFLLFSAMQGAATLIEERTSGIVDRIAVVRSGTDIVVISKFVFLTVQGVGQISLIFLLAWLAYGVDLPGRFLPWLVTTLATSCMAAALALAVATACTTKQQAVTISSFVVLIASAIGGSMVPRFMMPPWMQDIGWITPNAWAIEAYQGALWRGESLPDLLPELLPLLGAAAIGLVLAVWLARVRLRLA